MFAEHAVIMANLLEVYENLVLKLTRNQVDNIELLAFSRNLNLDDVGDDFVTRKYLLLRAVIMEISKVCDDAVLKYQSLLDEANYALKKKVKANSGFPCQVLGCCFKGSRHRDYINHLQKIHPSSEKYYCNYGRKCRRNFGSISDLEYHVSNSHLQHAISDASLTKNTCKCTMLSCGEKLFDSYHNLASHLNTVHLKQTRDCIFDGCGKTFNDGEVSRNHFRLKHFKINDVKLKACHSVAPETVSNSVLIHEDNVVTLDLEQICDNQDYAEDDGSDSISVAGDNEECHNFFMMSYCDFLNRLINVHFIPVSTVKIIAEQYLHLCKQSTTARTEGLKKSLNEHLDIKDVTMERVMTDHGFN